MSVEKYQPTPEEIRKAEESMDTRQRMMSERREKEEEVRELTLEVLKNNPELVKKLIAGNPKLIKFFMEKEPALTLGELGKSEFIENLPRDFMDVPDEERFKRPTFEDFRRNAQPNVFTKFVIAFVKAMKEDRFYVTTHQPRQTENTSMRLWRQRPEASYSGHPDWTENHDKAVLEAWGNPEWVRRNIAYIQKELQSSGENILGGGDFAPYYSEYSVQAKQEKK